MSSTYALCVSLSSIKPLRMDKEVFLKTPKNPAELKIVCTALINQVLFLNMFHGHSIKSHPISSDSLCIGWYLKMEYRLSLQWVRGNGKSIKMNVEKHSYQKSWKAFRCLDAAPRSRRHSCFKSSFFVHLLFHVIEKREMCSFFTLHFTFMTWYCASIFFLGTQWVFRFCNVNDVWNNNEIK